MGTFGSFAVGGALGFLFMLATAASVLARTLRKPRRAAGLERLARGATAWQALESPGGQPVARMWQGAGGRLLVSTTASPFGSWWSGARWEATTELPPAPRTHPTLPDTSWHALPDGAWLRASAGACAPALEPPGTALPALPRVEAGALHHRLRAATRTSAGDLLALVQHEDGAVRGWRLGPGADAWSDAGALPAPAAWARLVPGPSGDVLAVLGGGALALHDGAGWRALPPPREARIGWEAALAEDGAVLAGGGFRDTSRREAAARLTIGLGVLGLAALAHRALELGVVALLYGGAVGVMAAVAAFFLLWVFVLGARI